MTEISNTNDNFFEKTKTSLESIPVVRNFVDAIKGAYIDMGLHHPLGIVQDSDDIQTSSSFDDNTYLF